MQGTARREAATRTNRLDQGWHSRVWQWAGAVAMEVDCSGGGGTGRQGNGRLRARVRAGHSTARPGHEHVCGGWCGGRALLLVVHD